MSEFINTIDELGDDVVIDSIITRSITEFKDNRIVKVRGYAFSNCTALTTVDLPNVTTIDAGVFYGCNALTNVELPNTANIGGEAFRDCKSLTELTFPNLTAISGNGIFKGCTSLKKAVFPVLAGAASSGSYGQILFSGCTALTTVDFGVTQSVCGYQAFQGCTALTALILRGSNVASFASDNQTISATPIASGAGYIYVPRALVESYKVATNWSTYADQFRALEDYTVDGTTTGELDETKI